MVVFQSNYETMTLYLVFQSDQDDVGAGKLEDLENFRSQWQRELNEKNKEEIGRKQATFENSEEEDEEEDDIHRKVSVSIAITMSSKDETFIYFNRQETSL